jgi:hydroxycarboxylate dehydrogenase B
LSKLQLAEDRVSVPIARAHHTAVQVLQANGCAPPFALAIVDHLMDAELCGVDSHGIMRALQYADEFRRGYLVANIAPTVTVGSGATVDVDGCGGIGILAMDVATDAGISAAQTHGVAAIAVRNTGHTGRLGSFAEKAADAGCLFIACGGGARERWRMVTPYGGSKAVLPTNPWCLGIPGGAQGPVVLDCATGQIAGGWIYAARRAGAALPEGAIVDSTGNPTTDPADYFDGGAILPKGGVLGYGLATMGELICDAMLGPATVECNTFILMVDTARYRAAGPLQRAAEDILSELRNCPPAAGFDRVEVCGEREHARRAGRVTVDLPARTWEALCAAARVSGEGQGRDLS